MVSTWGIFCIKTFLYHPTKLMCQFNSTWHLNVTKALIISSAVGYSLSTQPRWGIQSNTSCYRDRYNHPSPSPVAIGVAKSQLKLAKVDFKARFHIAVDYFCGSLTTTCIPLTSGLRMSLLTDGDATWCRCFRSQWRHLRPEDSTSTSRRRPEKCRRCRPG